MTGPIPTSRRPPLRLSHRQEAEDGPTLTTILRMHPVNGLRGQLSIDLVHLSIHILGVGGMAEDRGPTGSRQADEVFEMEQLHGVEEPRDGDGGAATEVAEGRQQDDRQVKMANMGEGIVTWDSESMWDDFLLKMRAHCRWPHICRRSSCSCDHWAQLRWGRPSSMQPSLVPSTPPPFTEASAEFQKGTARRRKGRRWGQRAQWLGQREG